MSARFLVTLMLGTGMAIAASCCSAATTAGQSDGAPPATGSMYNGNNASPPNLASDDAHVDVGANQEGPELGTPVGDAKGGGSETAREGGGG
jgi:hypothetical protein